MTKFVFAGLLAMSVLLTTASASQPSVGEKAPDFSLRSVEGKTVRLSDITAKGSVVLIALRGFPGYQCPFCNRQVNEFIKSASEFEDRGVHVILIYPGPPDGLATHANEFTADKKLPTGFDLLLDPGYSFTNVYGLRWDAPAETGYPATFLIDKQGVVFFSKISHAHGGRSNPTEVLEMLGKKRPAI